MAAENRLWGQKRIQAELARLGFQVSAKYMRVSPPAPNRDMARVPDATCIEHVGLRLFLCPDSPVPDASRLLRHPAREQGGPPRCSDAASDSGLDRTAHRGMLRLGRAPPRFLIHGRDSRYGTNFDRRVRGLGVRQVRTPFRSPRATAVAERWVRSARSECLDHLIVFSEANLRRVLSRTSPITIADDRTARWARQFHAARQGPSLGKDAERPPRNLCLAGYTTFIALLHDKFLRPTSSRPTPNTHVSSSSLSPKSGVQSERLQRVCHNEQLTGCQNGKNTTG
jgi:hypothetical protein